MEEIGGITASQSFVDTKCEEQKWVRLDPLQTFKDIYVDYQQALNKVQAKLIEVDKRRGKEGSAVPVQGKLPL